MIISKRWYTILALVAFYLNINLYILNEDYNEITLYNHVNQNSIHIPVGASWNWSALWVKMFSPPFPRFQRNRVTKITLRSEGQFR